MLIFRNFCFSMRLLEEQIRNGNKKAEHTRSAFLRKDQKTFTLEAGIHAQKKLYFLFFHAMANCIKTFCADNMLNSAGILNSYLWIYAQTDQPVRKPGMPFIHGLSNNTPLICKSDTPRNPSLQSRFPANFSWLH